MDRRRREVKHVKPITVRLEIDDHEALEQVAREQGIPIAILARNWIKAALRDRRGKQHEGLHDDTRT